MAWGGIALHGMARYGVAWNGTGLHCTGCTCMVLHFMSWCDIAWHGLAVLIVHTHCCWVSRFGVLPRRAITLFEDVSHDPRHFFTIEKWPPPPPPFMRCFFVRFDTNSGTRRRIDIFQKRKMFRIEFPEILAWFQTPQTVSRPSRPDFQPRKTNSGTRRPIEIFKKRKMIRIEFPKLLAWFQTPQTVSRPSRPNFQPHRTVDVSNYIQLNAIINPWLVQKRLLPCSRWPRAALEV